MACERNVRLYGRRQGNRVAQDSSLAAHAYLITLSALARMFGGIVSPICLAVFRLITNSNLVGCSTGRSAGFTPFKILSTYVAER